jgi:SAM-dependent methyltransferase
LRWIDLSSGHPVSNQPRIILSAELPPYACPACRNAVIELRCTSCGTRYPSLAGLPVLLIDPQNALADWRNRWRLERQRLHREETQARSAATATTGTGRDRLQRYADGCRSAREHIELILAPMLPEDRGGARETLLGFRTRLPSHHAPTSYSTHIARDWCWGETENSESLVRIESLLQGERGSVLVPGSGAGRLAIDLGRRRPVLALESNPFLALLALGLLKGNSQQIVEFPTAPVSADANAVSYTINPPVTGSDTRFVLADLLNPPFAAASFDAVVTHWLIDVIDCPFDHLVSTVNHLLRPGGVWVNAGSAVFASADPVARLTTSEIEEAVVRGGFAVEARAEEETAYLQSPHSRQWRTERIFSFRAGKNATTPWQPWRYLPDWLDAGNAPVPLLPAFATQAASVRIHAWLMGMIDGKRGVADIAAEITRQGLMPADEATAAVRNFLKVMWEEMQRSG